VQRTSNTCLILSQDIVTFSQLAKRKGCVWHLQGQCPGNIGHCAASIKQPIQHAPLVIASNAAF
jgi:hypothetical protein